jgi:hypothetical protein
MLFEEIIAVNIQKLKKTKKKLQEKIIFKAGGTYICDCRLLKWWRRIQKYQPV